MRHINVHVGDSPLPLHPFSVAAAAAPPPPPPPLATPVCLGLFHFRGDALRILHFTNVPVISRDTRSFEFRGKMSRPRFNIDRSSMVSSNVDFRSSIKLERFVIDVPDLIGSISWKINFRGFRNRFYRVIFRLSSV